MLLGPKAEGNGVKQVVKGARNSRRLESSCTSHRLSGGSTSRVGALRIIDKKVSSGHGARDRSRIATNDASSKRLNNFLDGSLVEDFDESRHSNTTRTQLANTSETTLYHSHVENTIDSDDINESNVSEGMSALDESCRAYLVTHRLL